MSMYRNSRYRFCEEQRNADDVNMLTEREPFGYVDEPDNVHHTAKHGDTWWGLASIYFQGYDRACGLWWLLCDFQPTPVMDPTLAIQPGTEVIIPSMRMLRMQVFDNSRRRLH